MGPLQDVKIVEVGGIGPGPFCGMMLSDMGAEIIRVERIGQTSRIDAKFNVLHRNRRSITINLRKPEGVEALLKIIEQVDGLHEGFRPGVMERLGLGPDVCLGRNPKLVYGRMTGWGQDGPMAKVAGHDINYIALSGALHPIGRRDEKPIPPLNLVGEFGGGAMFLAFGMVCGLFEAQRSGKGQVIDASIVDGSAVLMAMLHGFLASGFWTDKREDNFLDGGSHFYNTYETKDGKYVSVGSIEPKFYALLLEYSGLVDPDAQGHWDKARWPELKEKLSTIFKSKTRDEWDEIMGRTDTCFAPVLSMSESSRHMHNKERRTFVEVEGVIQPAPAPRFSRTNPGIPAPPPEPGEHTEQVLHDFGFTAEEIDALRAANVC
jgi:alpha-methylacyl-CoA racemase